MKKIILATALLVALIGPAFAGEKDETSKMLNDLKAALKNTNQVQRTSTESYDKATFSVNGRSVSAFFSPGDGALIGFSRRLNISELPQGAAENIYKNYAGWNIADAIMFIESNAHVTYYAEVSKGRNHLALLITTNGKVSIFTKMPS